MTNSGAEICTDFISGCRKNHLHEKYNFLSDLVLLHIFTNVNSIVDSIDFLNEVFIKFIIENFIQAFSFFFVQSRLGIQQFSNDLTTKMNVDQTGARQSNRPRFCIIQ